MSEAEAERRAALAAGDLERAAAAEVALLAGMLGAQFGAAHVEAEQGLIMVEVGRNLSACASYFFLCAAPACFKEGLGVLGLRLLKQSTSGSSASTLLDSKRRRSCAGMLEAFLCVQADSRHVVVECKTGKVECADAGLQARVETAVRRLIEALTPASMHA
jgi:hypothetical protein